MRRLIAAYLFTALALFAAWQASAQMPMTGAGRGAPAGGGGCSQATTFLARTSGLSGTETTAYTNLICGMVTDGTWCGTTLDVLYIFATNTTTTANLNLCNTSHTLSQTGTVTFSADHGYTGGGSTGFMDTGYAPASGGFSFTQNSAQFGAYVLNSRTTGNTGVELGMNVANYNYIQPLISGRFVSWDINGASFPTAANSNAQGSWAVVRTGSPGSTVYKNETSFASTGSETSGVVPGGDMGIFTLAGSGDLSSDQLSAAWAGAGVSGTTEALIQHRINAYMTALGINVY